MTIEVENLSKSYFIREESSERTSIIKSLFFSKKKEIQAVNNVSFNVPTGQIVGFIGENGAGKSTTIKMMTGILSASKGKVLIDDINVAKHRKRVVNNIGVVFGQKTQLIWDIPVKDSLFLIKDIYQVDEMEFTERFNYFVKELNLSQILDQSVRQLSLGQRMRAELAMAFLHNPKTVFLDEPTIGLDVLVKQNIRNFILKVNQKYNTTIILTTHDLSDVENLCSRIILLDHGEIIFDGNQSKLFKSFGCQKFISIELLSETVTIIPEKYKKIISKDISNRRVRYSFNSEKFQAQDIIMAFIQANMNNIKNISIEDMKLEEMVRNIYHMDESVKTVK